MTICAAFLLPNCHCGRNYTLVTHTYSKPRLAEKTYTTEDAQTFPYRRFLADSQEPETIIIALHGFCGASIDYENLGNYLIKTYPHIGVYAYEVRGQGLDPVRERRGDIDQKENWFRDLATFTKLVRKKHPKAKILWQGESMGALILTETYRNVWNQGQAPLCDGIIITSPVVAVRGDFPEWKKQIVKSIAELLPNARLSLDALSGGQSVKMTATSTHNEQSETNAWHIEKHTLRLLVTLESMISRMNENATYFTVPVLVVHGGKDYFCEHQQVKNFYENIRKSHKNQYLFYPQAHHLLMYDQQKDSVIADIAAWVDAFNPRVDQAVK